MLFGALHLISLAPSRGWAATRKGELWITRNDGAEIALSQKDAPRNDGARGIALSQKDAPGNDRLIDFVGIRLCAIHG